MQNSPWSPDFGVEGALSWLSGVESGGGIGEGVGVGLGGQLPSGGSSKLRSIGTCDRWGARWCLHTYTDTKMLISTELLFLK